MGACCCTLGGVTISKILERIDSYLAQDLLVCGVLNQKLNLLQEGKPTKSASPSFVAMFFSLMDIGSARLGGKTCDLFFGATNNRTDRIPLGTPGPLLFGTERIKVVRTFFSIKD